MRSREAGRGAPADALSGDDAAYWKAVKSGDFIGIRDAEDFSARLAAPASAGAGADYTVGEIRSFALRGREAAAARRGAGSSRGAALGEYRFLELLKDGEGPLYLALAEPEAGAEGELEKRLYFIPTGLACGSRDELIDGGDTWLFLSPPDPEDFKSCDLEYAPYPDVPEIEEEGLGSRKLLFAPAGPGKSLYGEASDTGAAVIITEWVAEAPEGAPVPANPLLLALEEGWILPDGSVAEEGGYITVMLGKVLRAGELEHFPS